VHTCQSLNSSAYLSVTKQQCILVSH